MTGSPPVDILVAYRTQALVVFALVAVASIGLGYVLLYSGRRGRQLLWALTAVSLAGVLLLTLGPSGYNVRDEVWCKVQVVAPTLGRIELVANIALFFPLAFYGTLASRHPFVWLLACVGVSAAIEAIQAVAPVIGRACDTNDWLMNTIGSVAGVLVAIVTMALVARVASKTSS